MIMRNGYEAARPPEERSRLERNRFRGHRLSGEFVNVPIA
jgi:hypothetical protein